MSRHFCAGSACPGLPYRASDCEHPASCAGRNQSEFAAAYDRDALEAAAHAQATICSRCLETPPCDCDADERDAFECASMADAACAAVERTVLVCALAELRDAVRAGLDPRWADAEAIGARIDSALLTADEVLADHASVTAEISAAAIEAADKVPSVSPDADLVGSRSPSNGAKPS